MKNFILILTGLFILNSTSAQAATFQTVDATQLNKKHLIQLRGHYVEFMKAMEKTYPAQASTFHFDLIPSANATLDGDTCFFAGYPENIVNGHCPVEKTALNSPNCQGQIECSSALFPVGDHGACVDKAAGWVGITAACATASDLTKMSADDIAKLSKNLAGVATAVNTFCTTGGNASSYDACTVLQKRLTDLKVVAKTDTPAAPVIASNAPVAPTIPLVAPVAPVIPAAGTKATAVAGAKPDKGGAKPSTTAAAPVQAPPTGPAKRAPASPATPDWNTFLPKTAEQCADFLGSYGVKLDGKDINETSFKQDCDAASVANGMGPSGENIANLGRVSSRIELAQALVRADLEDRLHQDIAFLSKYETKEQVEKDLFSINGNGAKDRNRIRYAKWFPDQSAFDEEYKKLSKDIPAVDTSKTEKTFQEQKNAIEAICKSIPQIDDVADSDAKTNLEAAIKKFESMDALQGVAKSAIDSNFFSVSDSSTPDVDGVLATCKNGGTAFNDNISFAQSMNGFVAQYMTDRQAGLEWYGKLNKQASDATASKETLNYYMAQADRHRFFTPALDKVKQAAEAQAENDAKDKPQTAAKTKSDVEAAGNAEVGRAAAELCMHQRDLHAPAPATANP